MLASTTAPAVHTTTAPAPAPSGTPGARAGLRPTAGYGTYELCSGTCSGSVPSSLRRALRLPHASGSGCPASLPQGPVRALGGAQLTVERFVDSSWQGARVTWVASAGYSGPVLIRGRQLDGAGVVGFGEGHTPYDELQLLDSGQGIAPARGEREWLTFTRVRGPGCYAYQVDGTSFSEVLMFRAGG